MGALKELSGVAEFLAGGRVPKGGWVSAQNQEPVGCQILQRYLASLRRQAEHGCGRLYRPVDLWLSLKQEQHIKVVVGGDVIEQKLA